MNKLSDELLRKIFEFLTDGDFHHLKCVQKHWNNLEGWLCVSCKKQLCLGGGLLVCRDMRGGDQPCWEIARKIFDPDNQQQVNYRNILFMPRETNYPPGTRCCRSCFFVCDYCQTCSCEKNPHVLSFLVRNGKRLLCKRCKIFLIYNGLWKFAYGNM